MKILLSTLLLLFLVGLGCQSPNPFSKTQQQTINLALQSPGTVTKLISNPAVLGVAPSMIVDLGPPITTQTQFAGACPYDGTVNLSKTCTPTSYWTVNGTNVSQWTITYTCWRPSCAMDFSDYRLQVLQDTKSVRLPIVQ